MILAIMMNHSRSDECSNCQHRLVEIAKWERELLRDEFDVDNIEPAVITLQAQWRKKLAEREYQRLKGIEAKKKFQKMASIVTIQAKVPICQGFARLSIWSNVVSPG